MDDLAPAPTQRTSDNGGRTPGENLAARKKAVKKVGGACQKARSGTGAGPRTGSGPPT